MVERYSNVRLSTSRIKPVGQGKGRAEQEWTNLTQRHSRKKRNAYRKEQFLVNLQFTRGYGFVRIDDIHRITETIEGKSVSVIYGRYGTTKVKKSGDAVGVGHHGSTVGRWVFV